MEEEDVLLKQVVAHAVSFLQEETRMLDEFQERYNNIARLAMDRCGSYLNAVQCQSPEDMKILRDDCKIAFTSRAVSTGDKYSQGSTFFLRSDSEPRCTLERLAKEIFMQHTAEAQYDPTKSGAEWWVLCLHQIDDVGFHWDRDYGIELEENRLVHPNLGTVTYLSDIGGPTVFLDMVGNIPSKLYDGFPLRQCRVSYPRAGKHVTFDGHLLHGAPASLCPKTSSDSDESDGSESTDEGSVPDSEARITFLVNIWLDHLPTQAEPLPDTLIPSLSKSSSIQMAFVPTEALPLDCDPQSPLSAWSLSANDQSYRIAIPLPKESQLQESNRSSGETFLLQFDRDAGLLLANDPDDQEEEEEEEEEEPVVSAPKRQKRSLSPS
jgi:hypothetical protein